MAQIPKRARAETQTRTSPRPSRIRVEEPERSFTLFDESEVAEITDASRFEGQLSNISDDDMELPPLTPSPPGSEVGDDEEHALGNVDAPSDNVPSGDWKGTRKPSKGYHLPDTAENLCGPPPEALHSELTGLDKTQKEIIKKFCEYLTIHWPSQRLSSELAGSRHSAFVDPTGFWHALFQTEFPKYISFLENQRAANRSQRVRYSPFLPTFVSIA
jgi:hypothetical protein